MAIMKAKWTVLVYMAGNNSLSGAAQDDLGEMRKVGSSDAVRVLAFVKLRSRDAYRLEVRRQGQHEHPETLGNIDSGSPQTVTDFLRWGIRQAPAERYALVLWNHGGGWEPDDLNELYTEVRARRDTGVDRRELTRRASQRMARSMFSTTIKEILSRPTAAERQICNDDGSGHSLDTIEVGNILTKVTSETGSKIDLLGMDACLMSTLEVAYQVAEHVDVVVGSQELEPGAGWCYERILGDLAGQPAMTARELGKIVVDRYVASYRGQRSEWPVTQAALDTAKLETFAAQLDWLAKALRAAVGESWPEIVRAQAGSVRFESSLTDLRTLCRRLAAGGISPAFTQTARATLKSLEDGGLVLAEGHLGDEVKDCGGVSVYLPSPMDPVSKYYKDLRFAKRHRWDEFLSAYRTAAHPG